MLLGLCKVGGVFAPCLGIFYLFLWRMVQSGIFPKPTQWQAFVIISLLTLFVFLIALIANGGLSRP